MNTLKRETLSQSSRLWGTDRYVGDKVLTNFVDKTLSPRFTVTTLTRFPKGMIPTGLSGS